MTAFSARAEVDAARTLRLAVPCDLPPGPVDVVVQLATPDDDGVPADVVALLDSMDAMTAEQLWRAARSRLAADARERLADLNDLHQRAALSAEETRAKAGPIRQYDVAVLVRAQAAALLHGRGHDISTLLAP